MRRVSYWMAAAALAVGITACGSGDSNDTTTSAASGDNAPAATAGGTLRYVTVSEPDSLNPYQSGIGLSIEIRSAFMDRLVALDADGNPTLDGIATEVEKDGDAFTVTVRDGVTFHNGEKLDGEAVAFILNLAKESPQGIRTMLGKVEATGSLTAKAELVEPARVETVKALLSELFVVPPKYFEEVGGEAFGRKPVGSGPFVFERWNSGRGITGKRNDDYWGEKAKLDGVEVSFNSTDAGRVSLVRAGNADLIGSVSPPVFSGVENASGVRTASRVGPYTTAVGFTKTGPLEDPKVRQAMAHLIDRDAIAGRVYRDQAQARTSMFSPVFDPEGAPPTGPDVAFPHDPAKAKQLIDEARAAGTKVDEPIEFSYRIGAFPLDKQLGESLAATFKQAGLNIRQNPMESGAFVARWLDGKMRGAFLTQYSAAYPDLMYYSNTYFKKDALFPYCVTERSAELAANAQKEEDPEKARELFAELEQFGLREDPCVAPIQQRKDNYTMSDKLGAFAPRVDFTLPWTTLGFAAQ